MHFDSHDPAIAVCPWPAYKLLRADETPPWSDVWEGFWVAAKYEDVLSVAHDRRFSTSLMQADGTLQGVTIPPPGNSSPMIPLEMDPPGYRRYRQLFSTYFSPSRTASRIPEYQKLASACLDDVIDQGACDIVDALTLRLPAILALRDLGLPEDRWPEITDLVHYSMLRSASDPEGALEASQIACMEVAQTLLEDEEASNDSFAGYLRRNKVDGRPVSMEEIISMAYVLLIGVDPTSTLTSTTLWHLAKHPDLRAELVGNPDRVDAATDEFLRWVTPVQGAARTANTDTEIGGQCVRSNQRAYVSWGSANQDEKIFPEPEVVELERDARKHLAFGAGPHYCAGAPAARAMFQVMVKEVLKRIPDYQLTPEGDDWFDDLTSIYGIRSLQITY